MRPHPLVPLIALYSLFKLGNSLNQHPSRRRFVEAAVVPAFAGACSGTTGLVVGGAHIVPARAAPPVAQEELETPGARLLRDVFRPKPPRVLRPRLDKDFAVLLMRCSYNALDDLDCVAMDQFQRDFFLIRQAEYQPYVNYLGPGMVQQGDLTDPYYFDFISFAQYLAINREVSGNPPFVFEERQPRDVGEGLPFEFVPVVVRRDPALTNDRLAPEHGKRVGSAILTYIDETLGSTDAGLPKLPLDQRRPNPEQVNSSFSQLVNIFIINGFAWDGTSRLASTDPDGTSEFVLTLGTPATLWGGQCLLQQRSPVTNQFLCKTATLLALRLGYLVVSTSVKYDGTKEITSIKLR